MVAASASVPVTASDPRIPWWPAGLLGSDTQPTEWQRGH